jgi:chorismate mutase
MQSTHLIRKAIKAVDAEIAKYSKTRATLAGLISTTKNGNNVVPIRSISAAGRRRIAAAQRLRWAKIKRKKAA